MTGWATSGVGNFCNSNPAVICLLAARIDDTTVENRLNSPFYDLGTWVFHGTGFTGARGVVQQYFTNTFGNNTTQYRAARINDATVPALPIVGVALIGSSLVVGGLIAIRRKRDD